MWQGVKLLTMHMSCVFLPPQCRPCCMRVHLSAVPRQQAQRTQVMGGQSRSTTGRAVPRSEPVHGLPSIRRHPRLLVATVHDCHLSHIWWSALQPGSSVLLDRAHLVPVLLAPRDMYIRRTRSRKLGSKRFRRSQFAPTGPQNRQLDLPRSDANRLVDDHGRGYLDWIRVERICSELDGCLRCSGCRCGQLERDACTRSERDDCSIAGD